MTDVPGSPFPRDPDYWEELARRIRDDASGPLAAYASWYGALARRASWLVVAAAAAMVVLWLALPMTDDSAAHRWMERALAPSETAGTLIGGPVAPSVDALLAQFPPLPAEEEAK